MTDRATHVLIAGVSTRAAADSAARAGFRVTAIDAFADLDQHPGVQARAVERFSAAGAVTAARDVRCDAAVYLSPFENHPAAVRRLAIDRALWGNPPDVLARARDPLAVADAFRARGIASPLTSGASDFSRTSGDWLLKPVASGGGHGVRLWREGATIPRGHYLQQFVEGTPASIVFVAAARRAVPLAVTRQLIGEAAFGAADYRYCGNIIGTADLMASSSAHALAQTAAAAFDLVGLNGIDLVIRDGVPWVVEINPRWCASMELAERAYDLPMFDIHASACVAGTLPAFDLKKSQGASRAFGKAVLFARQRVTVGDTRAWLESDRDGHAAVRDIPHPGTRIAGGRPVCTIFATGRDAAACYDALQEHAARVYAQLAA